MQNADCFITRNDNHAPDLKLLGACQLGHIKQVQNLISGYQKQDDLNLALEIIIDKFYTELEEHHRCCVSYVNMVKMLLKHGVCPDEKQNFQDFVQMSQLMNDAEVAELFISNKVVGELIA